MISLIISSTTDPRILFVKPNNITLYCPMKMLDKSICMYNCVVTIVSIMSQQAIVYSLRHFYFTKNINHLLVQLVAPVSY